MCGRIRRRDQREQGNEGDEGKETILNHTSFQNAIMIFATLYVNLKNKNNPSTNSWNLLFFFLQWFSFRMLTSLDVSGGLLIAPIFSKGLD